MTSIAIGFTTVSWRLPVEAAGQPRQLANPSRWPFLAANQFVPMASCVDWLALGDFGGLVIVILVITTFVDGVVTRSGDFGLKSGGFRVYAACGRRTQQHQPSTPPPFEPKSRTSETTYQGRMFRLIKITDYYEKQWPSDTAYQGSTFRVIKKVVRNNALELL